LMEKGCNQYGKPGTTIRRGKKHKKKGTQRLTKVRKDIFGTDLEGKRIVKKARDG